MKRLVVLDTGPLGLLTHPRPSPEATACLVWMRKLLAASVRVAVPAVADYELRREYLRRNATAALRELNALPTYLEWLSLSDDALRRAAQIWAMARQAGRPLADPKALDGDCILAAQTRMEAESVGLDDSEFIIATSDVGDLPFLAPAAAWQKIVLP